MSTDKNSEIRLNRKMRTWNKYKNYIFGGAAVIILIIIVMLLVKSCGKKDDDKDAGKTPSQSITESASAPEGTEDQSSQPSTQEPSTQQPTTAAVKTGIYTTSKTAAKEDLTQKDFYSNSVFLGDAIVNGIEYYKFLDDDKVFSDVNLTTDKASKHVDEIVAKNPANVFILLGINDLNYGSRSVETIVSNYKTLLNDIHAKLPSANIYVISVLPITKAYESKDNIYIKKSNIDEMNNQLQALAGSGNVGFVNITGAFQDGSGYLDTNVTGNGLNLTSNYYGFLLNTIAEMVK